MPRLSDMFPVRLWKSIGLKSEWRHEPGYMTKVYARIIGLWPGRSGQSPGLVRAQAFQRHGPGGGTHERWRPCAAGRECPVKPVAFRPVAYRNQPFFQMYQRRPAAEAHISRSAKG